MNKKIVVTGASGFLGSYLVRYLVENNYDVIATGRRAEFPNMISDLSNQVEYISGDLSDYQFTKNLVKRASKIYHTAARVAFQSKEQRQIYLSNVSATEHLVNESLSQGISKFLFVSSVAALGRNQDQTLISETANWEQTAYHSIYSKSKYQSERMVWRAIEEGMQAVIVNPSIIVGAGEWKEGSPSFIPLLAKGLSFYPKGSSGFVDVRDVASLSHQLMESQIIGERFILSAENLSFQELFSLIAQNLQKKIPRKPISNQQIYALSYIDKFFSTILGIKQRLPLDLVQGFTAQCAYDNTKLLDQFDFQYRTISSCIEQTAGAFIQSQNKGKNYGLLDFNQ